MDLESENSALESTGDNDVVSSANPSIEDDVKIHSNGSYEHHDDGRDLNSNGNGQPSRSLDPVKTNEDAHKLDSDKHGAVKLQSESASLLPNRSTSGEHVDSYTVINTDGKGTENDQHVVESPLSPPNVPSGSPGMSPPATGTKGKGLKKWRRIRREVTKDNTASRDVTKILKRASENPLHPLDVAAEMKLKSEGSVSSTNALIDNTVGADAFSIDGSSSNYEVAGGSTFSVGADSDNSKDRSSKSSTAASVPRFRHDLSRPSSYSREKQKTKHLGGKHLATASQRLQQGAFQAVKMDKENSLSSLESDSRSYSSVFMQGSSSVISNGHSERIMGFDNEHGFDGTAGEQLSVEGMPTGSNKSVRENEEFSPGDAALSWQMNDRSKNHQLSGNRDPLVDCARMLLSTQETLEQEIQKFGELGKDLQPVCSEVCRAASTSEDAAAQNDPDALEVESMNQSLNIYVLEKQLEEAFGVLKVKESRITELEATINVMKQSKADFGRSIEIQQKKYKEIETEMEGLFKQKMEAEMKYIAVEDKRIIVEKQLQTLVKTDHSESKAAMSKDKVEEKLSTQTCIRKMQNRAAKFCFCFLIQLILVIFMLQFFMSQFLPKSEMIMPT